MTDHVCPECGRAFDPADPASLRLPRHLRPRKVVSIHAAGDVGLVAVGLVGLGQWLQADAAVSLGWLLAVLLLLLLVGQRIAGVLDWVSGPLTPSAAAVARTSRRLATACVVATLACDSTLGRGACPHSRWFLAGPVGLSHSPGGMCDNRGAPVDGLPIGSGWYVITPQSIRR